MSILYRPDDLTDSPHVYEAELLADPEEPIEKKRERWRSFEPEDRRMIWFLMSRAARRRLKQEGVVETTASGRVTFEEPVEPVEPLEKKKPRSIRHVIRAASSTIGSCIRIVL